MTTWATTVTALVAHYPGPTPGRAACGVFVDQVHDTRPDLDVCVVCTRPQVVCTDCGCTVSVVDGLVVGHYPYSASARRGPRCGGQAVET